jgi:predicted kinase
MAGEVVILVGLPGAGKTTFFRERFAGSHAHVSKDNFRNNARPAVRQRQLIAEALVAGRPVLIDNINAAAADRAEIIAAARAAGARVIGYFFDCTTRECVARNARREGRARIPNLGIFAAAKRLQRPTRAEGFDQLYLVRLTAGRGFEVVEMEMG